MRWGKLWGAVLWRCVLSKDSTVSNSGTQAVRFVSRVSPTVWRVLCENVAAIVWQRPFMDHKDARAPLCKGTTLLKVNYVYAMKYINYPVQVVSHFPSGGQWGKNDASTTERLVECLIWSKQLWPPRKNLFTLTRYNWSDTVKVLIIERSYTSNNGDHNWYHIAKSITLSIKCVHSILSRQEHKTAALSQWRQN